MQTQTQIQFSWINKLIIWHWHASHCKLIHRYKGVDTKKNDQNWMILYKLFINDAGYIIACVIDDGCWGSRWNNINISIIY